MRTYRSSRSSWTLGVVLVRRCQSRKFCINPSESGEHHVRCIPREESRLVFAHGVPSNSIVERRARKESNRLHAKKWGMDIYCRIE